MELQWPLILFTLFLCLCGGIMAMRGVLLLLKKGKNLQKSSLVCSAIALVVGGLAVMMHLRQPGRIFNGFGALLGGNGFGAFGITLELWGCVVFAVMLVLFFLFMRRFEEGVAPTWAAVFAVVVGIALPIVTGCSYLMASIPAWNTPLLIVFYLVNTVLLGSSAISVMAVCKHDREALAFVVRVCLGSAVLQAIVLVAYGAVIGGFGQFGDIDFYFDPTHPDTAMVDTVAVNGSLVAGSQALLFWGGVGVLAALCLVLSLAPSAACVLAGSLVWRCLLYVVAVHLFALF